MKKIKAATKAKKKSNKKLTQKQELMRVKESENSYMAEAHMWRRKHEETLEGQIAYLRADLEALIDLVNSNRQEDQGQISELRDYYDNLSNK